MATAAPDLCTTPPERRPGVWSGLGTVALYFLLQFGISLLVGAGIGFWIALKAGVEAGVRHRKPENLRAVIHTAMANPDLRVLLAVITIAAAAAVMIAIVHHTWPAQWSRADLPGFGFTRPKRKLVYFGAVVLVFPLMLVGGGISHLLAGSHPVHQDIEVMLGKVPLGMRLLLALMAVCVAPLVEELVFRGVLLSGLARRMRVGWAALGSALIFGCAHLPDFQFAWYPIPELVLLGLVLAWLRLKSRSLWPSITLHATFNFIAMLVWLAATRHP